MSRDLGIEIEVRETQTNDEMMELMKDGQADVIADFFSDFNWGKEHNARLSFPYLELNYVAVTRRGAVLPERPRAACPSGHYYTYLFLEKMFPAGQRVYYDTPGKCLAAVSVGQADITYTKAVTAQQDIWNGGFYNLVTNGNVAFSHNVSMAVSSQADPILLRILNKEISHLNPDEIQGIVSRTLFSTKEEGSLRSYVYRYPMQFLLGVLLLAAWVAARWLARPIDRLAAAARELGRDIARPPLPEDGTRECREASRVFNQMQARIRRQLQDRDRFVAAVSHDLRTPLTRLRLRAEALPDGA